MPSTSKACSRQGFSGSARASQRLWSSYASGTLGGLSAGDDGTPGGSGRLLGVVLSGAVWVVLEVVLSGAVWVVLGGGGWVVGGLGFCHALTADLGVYIVPIPRF